MTNLFDKFCHYQDRLKAKLEARRESVHQYFNDIPRGGDLIEFQWPSYDWQQYLILDTESYINFQGHRKWLHTCLHLRETKCLKLT